MAPIDFTLRWAVRVNDAAWNPGPDEWERHLALLPAHEQADVSRFVQRDDQKRALASRLMQRAAISLMLDMPWGSIDVQRTKGRRPFVANAPEERVLAPNLNYNVSHEGDYVVLASEPLCLVGVDVSAPRALSRARPKPVCEWLSAFKRQLTPAEWEAVWAAGPNERALEDEFRLYWSLKEAFVKARGDGIAFDMGRTQFAAPDGSVLRLPTEGGAVQAVVAVDGVAQPGWRFFSERLPNGHIVSVARGPPGAVVDALGSFRRTFLHPEPDDAELQAALDAPPPGFREVSIGELLPTSC